MKIKDFLELDIVKLAEMYDGKQPAKEEPKTAAVKPDGDAEAKPKYEGEGNPMKLRKMCVDRGIDAPTKKNAAFYVDLLLKDDAKGKSAGAAAAMNKPAAGELSVETYDKSKTYTEEQLKTVAARGLYDIGRKVFDIPRDQLKNKNDSIAAILKAQGGGVSAGSNENSDDQYDGMKAKELYTLCKERGIDVEPKLAASVYKNLLVEDDAKEFDDEADEFDGMSVVELYKMCKKIDPAVKQKQDRSYYLDILRADKEDQDGDDWGDDPDSGDEWEMN